jgi:hypothetical protein
MAPRPSDDHAVVGVDIPQGRGGNVVVPIKDDTMMLTAYAGKVPG